MVNLEWYRTFKAIYERGTLTGAAEVLFITQPGVSQQLTALENYMGVKLFDRKPRKMLPTAHGIQLYNQIEGAVLQLEKTEANFKRKTLVQRPLIKVGMPLEMFDHAFAQVLNQLEFDVIFSFDSPEELQDKLFKKELDLIVTTLKTNYQHVEYQHFFAEEQLLVCNPEINTVPFHQYLYNRKLKEAEDWLAQCDWYSYSQKMGTIKSFWRNNFKRNPYFQPRFVIPSLTSMLKAIQQNSGLALLPKSICEKALEKGTIKELWQGIETTYHNKYFGIQTQSKNLKPIEEIIEVVSAYMKCKD